MGDIELTRAELDELERAFDDASPKEEIGAFLGTGAWASAGDVASFRRLISLARSGLEARKAEESMRERAGFPILGSKGASVDLQLVLDHGKQAYSNHHQTVERLAQRGGLSWCELYAVLHNRAWQKMDQNEAMIACRALEAKYLTAIRALPLTEGGDTP